MLSYYIYKNILSECYLYNVEIVNYLYNCFITYDTELLSN